MAPVMVAALALAAYWIEGMTAALAAVAVGALAIIVWNLLQLDALTRWASGPIEVPVPEGRGTWALAYAALYHRVRLRSARQRDLRLALDRFVSGAKALPEGVVVLDANDRIEWVNPRAKAHLGLDLKHDRGAPIVNLVRHPAFVPLLLSVSSDAKALSSGRHEITLTIRDAATLLGSREELASAFGNLVSNAVRYTPEGGRIALEWRITGDGGEFTVADSGIGIASEHLPRLTERFYRVDRSRSRATGGTGLGLAIVKHVLIRHPGELTIDSEAGNGSRFTVRLPLDRVRFVADDATAHSARPDRASADTNASEPRSTTS